MPSAMTTPGHGGRSMAANQVPDELISEILSPLLKHSDEVFSERSEKAFLRPGYSSSTYLMVCKSWLRVSTPLLYNVVILRTTAQAAALEKVLQAHPEIGVFIKKLRVEGGFGTAMHTILARSPNITDLFLSAFIYGTDSVKGLCSGLPLIDPQRVILFDATTQREKPKKNKQVTQLLDALCLAVTKWNNLRIFDFPYIATHTIAFQGGAIVDQVQSNPRAEALASGLEKSKSLEVFLMNLGDGIPDYLRLVANAPALKTIRLTGWKRPLDLARIELQKFNDPKLVALVQWEIFDPPPSPRWDSRSPSPVLPEKVEQLSELESLGQTPGAATLEEMIVDLTSFGAHEFGRRPAKRTRPPAVNPEILRPFVALTKLHWATQGDHSKLCFSSPPPNFTALENLQKLKVRSYLKSPSLLDIGMKLPLSSLQDVDLGDSDNVEGSVAFLKVHGARLVRIKALIEVLREIKVFDFCTSLRTLVVDLPSPNAPPRRQHIPDDFISATTPHANLTKIGFEGWRDLESAMKPNFTQLLAESFPALKEIQLKCIKWPKSEQQVAKNKWIPLSELLRPKNITLVDEDGVGGTRPATGKARSKFY